MVNPFGESGRRTHALVLLQFEVELLKLKRIATKKNYLPTGRRFGV